MWFVGNEVLVHCNEDVKKFYALTSTIDKHDRMEVFGLGDRLISVLPIFHLWDHLMFPYVGRALALIEAAASVIRHGTNICQRTRNYWRHKAPLSITLSGTIVRKVYKNSVNTKTQLY